jgi:hypothetical protein
VIAVVLVLACDGLGWIQLGTRFEREIALKWLPVNSFFVAMLFTGFLRWVGAALGWHGPRPEGPSA